MFLVRHSITIILFEIFDLTTRPHPAFLRHSTISQAPHQSNQQWSKLPPVLWCWLVHEGARSRSMGLQHPQPWKVFNTVKPEWSRKPLQKQDSDLPKGHLGEFREQDGFLALPNSVVSKESIQTPSTARYLGNSSKGGTQIRTGFFRDKLPSILGFKQLKATTYLPLTYQSRQSGAVVSTGEQHPR